MKKEELKKALLEEKLPDEKPMITVEIVARFEIDNMGYVHQCLEEALDVLRGCGQVVKADIHVPACKVKFSR